LIDNLVNGTSIRFNQDNLDFISAVENVLKLELNNSFSNILSKLFNTPIDELEAEIKILKHMPECLMYQVVHPVNLFMCG